MSELSGIKNVPKLIAGLFLAAFVGLITLVPMYFAFFGTGMEKILYSFLVGMYAAGLLVLGVSFALSVIRDE